MAELNPQMRSPNAESMGSYADDFCEDASEAASPAGSPTVVRRLAEEPAPCTDEAMGFEDLVRRSTSHASGMYPAGGNSRSTYAPVIADDIAERSRTSND